MDKTNETIPNRPFRFYDNRQKYLMFVTTCGEKWAVVERVDRELAHLAPKPPALRVFELSWPTIMGMGVQAPLLC